MTITEVSPQSISRDPNHQLAVPISPGEILWNDFMAPLGINQRTLARAIDVPPIRISEIVRGLRAISADTALRLAAYFGTTPQLWLSLQANWDLSKASRDNQAAYEHITPVNPTKRPRSQRR